jgi:hypothetical protein
VSYTGSKFVDGEEVVLRCDKEFVSFRVTGRMRKIFYRGDLVKVDRVEPLFDDHGRFSRFWYHLKQGLSWTTIVEEDVVGKAGILERLADI